MSTKDILKKRKQDKKKNQQVTQPAVSDKQEEPEVEVEEPKVEEVCTKPKDAGFSVAELDQLKKEISFKAYEKIMEDFKDESINGNLWAMSILFNIDMNLNDTNSTLI
jgi:hypothetical protein